MTEKFFHAHCHSEYSLIDGLSPIPRLVRAAAEKDFKALAITDHGNLSGTLAFMAACKANSIKPVIGMEAYVERESKVFHLTILANGNEGFRTLTELNNIGQRGDFSKPAFPLSLFSKYNKGLTILTGCPASPMQALDWPDARQIALELKGIFGDRLFAEMMFVSDSHAWERAAKLSRDLKLHPVVTNDVHFPYASDAPVHQILVQLKAAFSYNSSLLYLATAADITKRAFEMAPEMSKYVEAGIHNAYILGNKLESPVFSSKPSLPHIDNAFETLTHKAASGVSRYLLNHPELDPSEYAERMNYELSIIKEMDFATYFVILEDIISFARSSGVRVGPGRGSGAGSLVLFLIGCTEIDPLLHGLKFERFLNPKRKEMPDVDTDFDSEGRELVIKYAQSRWGGLPVATYSRYSDKVLTADLCRYFRVPRDISERASDEGPEGDTFASIAKMNPHFQEAFVAMKDQVRHIGQHAGGIIITDQIVPLTRTADKEPVTAWTEGHDKEMSSVGIIKYDLLGITALTVLDKLEKKFGKHAELCTDDSPVFSLFQTGDTLGIFQFSGSDGIINFTKTVFPTKFSDLVAINALYRPGALDSGATKNYPEWRKSPRSFHPFIDDILAETFGVICYQEQFMEIFARMVNGDLGDADDARKVIVKSDPGNPTWEVKMSKLRNKFFEGGESNGIPTPTVSTIWSEITTWARYGFNKSHSVAYSQISWELAWWKKYYSVDFYATMLSTDLQNAQKYMFDIASRGVKIVPPDINKSTKDYESDGKQIFIPLSSVKFLGETGVKAIIAARPFSSISDFMARIPKKVINTRARLGLYELGAFNGIPGTRSELQIIDKKYKDEAHLQTEHLGFFIPNKEFIDAINNAKARGWIGGIIDEKEERESKYGKYQVFKLLPYGTVWARGEFEKLEEGQVVKLKTNKNSGKVIRCEPLL